MSVSAAGVSSGTGVSSAGVSGAGVAFTSWQLAPGHWIPAKMSMRLVHPRTSTTSTYIYENWYTGMALDLPVCVQGGAWPFYYELTTAPSGMAVGQQYGDANYGRITWASPTAGSHSIAVRVTDQDGNSVTHSWTLTVGTSKHVFFDAVNGNDANSGTISSPYKTFAAFASTDKFTPALQGKICVYRTGTYKGLISDPLTNGGGRYLMGSNKPLVHIAYPGETVTFDFSDVMWSYAQGARNEIAHVGMTITGAQQSSNPVALNFAQYIAMSNANRTLFDSMTFTQTGAVTSGDNPACIFFGDDNPCVDMAITNCTFDGLDGFFAAQIYDIQYSIIERNTLKNLVTRGAFYLKLAATTDNSVRNNVGILNNATPLVRVSDYASVTRTEVCWNNFKSSTYSILFGEGNNWGTDICWGYRNTIQATGVAAAMKVGGSVVVATIENSVLVHNSTIYTDGIENIGFTGTLNQSNNLQTASTAYTDANGALTGTYRTSYLGLRGYEVA